MIECSFIFIIAITMQSFTSPCKFYNLTNLNSVMDNLNNTNDQ